MPSGYLSAVTYTIFFIDFYRIRNLEDLLRQLEHHTGGRHLSPTGSEDIRLSETEADRHYHRGLHSADLGGFVYFSNFVLGIGIGIITTNMFSTVSLYVE